MPDPRDRPSPPERRPLSPENRQKVIRAAALRPIHLLMLLIGGVFFVTSGLWWIAPMTIFTYGALVALAVRNPIFEHRVLEGRPPPRPISPAQDLSPERRARWLPRGETRSKVEAALDVYRKVLRAIEESDDVTRSVLEDAPSKLHAAANRLVDLAGDRETAAEALLNLPENPAEAEEGRRDLDGKIRAADAEISGVIDNFLVLRARVVRISLDSGPTARAMAGELNSSLDELNFRLEALGETMSSPENNHQTPG